VNLTDGTSTASLFVTDTIRPSPDGTHRERALHVTRVRTTDGLSHASAPAAAGLWNDLSFVK